MKIYLLKNPQGQIIKPYFESGFHAMKHLTHAKNRGAVYSEVEKAFEYFSNMGWRVVDVDCDVEYDENLKQEP